MKIGVLGGTFNPIHNGHLIIAEETRARLDLTEVLFMPAGQPWMREDNPVLTSKHRVQMVRLAISGKPWFRLSTMEIDNAGPSYTVDTLIELQAQLGNIDEIFFILGWDNLAQFPRWKEPSRIIKMCHLVAVPRPGYSPPDLDSLEAVIPGLPENIVILDKPWIDISASEIRERVAQGLPINHLVPETVEEYIRQNKLYLIE
jgi:nicotinate-nucleotide adenylyltransferase